MHGMIDADSETQQTYELLPMLRTEGLQTQRTGDLALA
jgi:hypothetical protein